MVIKNLENKIKLVLIICSRKQNQAGADYMFPFPCRLHHHLHLQHLDSQDNGLGCP